MESALSFCEWRNVVFDEHGFSERLFINGRIGNREAALLAFRPEIFHQIRDQFFALAGSKRARHQARPGISKRALHQIDSRVPLRFIPLLVGQEVGTVAEDAGPLNRFARVTWRIKFIIR